MALASSYDDLVNLKSILLLLFVFLLATWWVQKPRNLPPGPWCFPFIGFVPQLIWYLGYKKVEIHHLATRLGRKYGDICSFDIFGHVVVVIKDFATIREAFNNPALSDKGFNNEFEEKMFGRHCEYWLNLFIYFRLANVFGSYVILQLFFQNLNRLFP